MEAIVDNATTILHETNVQFTWHDYSIFTIMLVLSALIGIYFGCFGKKQSSADEYLLGGKEMGVFEIAMSLIASHISGITILAVPSDVYRFGANYWLCSISVLFAILTSLYLTIPVFYKLQTPSTYEYLKMRFDERIRSISSLLFTIGMFLYLPIVIYVPALALAQGTGYGIHYITPLICGVCIFYTTIGGLKAVVWTDALQFVLMIFATIAVTWIGVHSLGGLSEVWKIASEGERTEIDFDFDLTKRDTFWSVFFGFYFIWGNVACFSQGCIQKSLALPSMAHIKRAFIIFGIGMFAFISFSVYMGLMIYAKYYKCDPYTSKQIQAHDQLLPHYVINVTGHIPGLSGLFIAGVFSAALSSLSAAMNCLSCTLYEDFISSYMPKNSSQAKISFVLKCVVAAVGIICTLLVLIVEHLGSILQLGLSLAGVTGGPLTGLFALGMFVPSANSKGAFYGTIGSLIIMTWIVLTSQYYKMSKYIVYETKPLSTAECPGFNATYSSAQLTSDWEPMYIFRISHYYYLIMGTFLVFIIALPISWLTKSDGPVDKNLISPIMHWAVPKVKKDTAPEYYSVEKALEIMKEHPSKV